MTSPYEHRIEALEQRVHRSEREASRWRRASLAAGVALTLTYTLGVARQDQEPAVQELLRVRALEVVDEAGAVLVRAGADDAGNGEVRVASSKGGVAAFLGAGDGGHGAAGVLSDKGTLVGFLGASAKGDGSCWVSWSGGEQVNYVGADPRRNGRVPAEAKSGRRL